MTADQIKTWLIALLLFAVLPVFSQRNPGPKNRVGGAVVYNFQTRGLGIDARSEFPIHRISLLEGLSVVPQVSYYPWMFQVSEFYIGSSVHLGVYSINTWRFYTLLNLSFNGVINSDDSNLRNDNFANFGLEAGIGVSTKLFKCMHPFAEFRYNPVWNELNGRLGLMYDLKCDRRGAVPCSKIPPQPQF